MDQRISAKDWLICIFRPDSASIFPLCLPAQLLNAELLRRDPINTVYSKNSERNLLDQDDF